MVNDGWTVTETRGLLVFLEKVYPIQKIEAHGHPGY